MVVSMRVDVNLVLIDRQLGIDRIDLILGFLIEHEQFADLREGLAVEYYQVFGGQGSGSTERTKFGLVLTVEVGLCRQVELCRAFEGTA